MYEFVTKKMGNIPVYILIMLLGIMSCQTENKPDRFSDKNNLTESSKVEAVKSVVVFGNSLTAAYGLSVEDGFPAILQRKIDSLSLNYQVINAGNSGETSSGGLGRIDWILRSSVAIFVLELGANDGLRGIPPEETYKNLAGIIEKVKLANPEVKVVLCGMEAPPNMGEEYTKAFRAIFPRLAAASGSALVPFLLEGVAGIPSLNQEDRIHPTAEGQKILAENVWSVLMPLLEK